MEVGDLTGLCLLAEGFPRDADPRWVAACIAQNSRISVHQLAPVESDTSASPSNWILRFRSHEEQKVCLVKYRKLQVPFMNEVLQITLNIPSLALRVPPLEAWTTMDEDPNRLDSIQSSELFGSGYGDTKECPGAGPSQGLLGPGEHPPGAQYHAGEPSAQYPPFHQHPSPGYSPSMPGPGQHRGRSDPSLAAHGGGSYYPQSYQQQFPFGEGGQYHMPYNMAPGGYQHGPGMHGYAGMEQGFSEMSFDDQGYQQPGPYSEYSSGGNLDSSTMDGGDMQSDFVVLGYEGAGAMRQFYLRVTELPPQVTEQELHEFFHDRKVSGGGPIERVVLDPSGTSAAVYFKDTDVIDRVVRQGPHLLRNKKIMVEPAAESQHRAQAEETRTVEIRDIDDEDFTEMCLYYFENPSKGGGDIEESHWDEKEKVFFITFVEAAVAKEVASRGHKIGGKVLEVALYEPQPEEEDTGPQCTVEVGGIDPAKEELYQMYFENPRKGGGNITELCMNEERTVLYITFEDSAVAERVASMSHKIGGRDLDVKLAPKEEPDNTPPCTVKVTGGDTEQEELYTVYFENPRKGGGAISDVEVDKKQQAYFITFEDPAVAADVCNRQHKISGHDLQVTLHVPKRGTERQRSREVPAEEEEEEMPRTTVEVTGSEPLQSEDTYLYYFENPRNGGGEVAEVDIDREKGVVYVTFRQPKVAEKVAGRQHKISGQPVQVKIFVPPKPKPTYTNKLLFQNVADSTTTDCLSMYLERVTGLEPAEILYGDEPGVVLVTFDEEPDFAKTQEMCHKKKLEKRQLTVSKVPISNCLLVEGLDPNTTEDTVVFYFENKRRGGGGPVERVEIIRDGDVHRAFVYFEEHEVLDQVLVRSHKIDNRSLQVKCYMECLGLSGGSVDPTVFALPKPLVLEDLDKFKIAFIRQTGVVKEDFVQQLAEINVVTRFRDNTVTLECSLTKDIPKARILAKTWTNDAMRATATFFASIDVHRLEIMQPIWPEVEKTVVRSDITRHDKFLMFPLAEEYALVVVGKGNAARDFFADIKGKVRAIEEEVERKKQEVTDTNNKLKIHQLRLLAAMSFHTEAGKRHPGLTIDIKTKKGEITFHGMMHDVKEAQVEMYDLLNSVKSEKITDLSDMQKKLLDKVETRNVIVQKFRPEQVVAVWEVGKDVTVHGFSDENVVKAIRIIRKSVVQHVCRMTPESAELLRSQDWLNMVKVLVERNGGKLMIVPSHDNQQVYITGTDDIMHGVVEEVENFIQDNAIYSEVVHYSPSRQKFVATYWQNKLQQINNALKAYKVQVILKENHAEIYASGTSVGLDQLKKRLQQLEEEIILHVETFSDVAKVKFLTSGKCEKDLDMLGRSQNCVLALEPEPAGLQVVKSAGTHGLGSALSGGDMKTSARVQLPSGVTVSVVHGDLTQMTVDVIVNAANSRMDHIGGLARDIVQKGGKSIQEECFRSLKARGGQLRDGDVLVSEAGTLPCKAIIHAVGPMYRGGRSGEEDCLHDTVVRCLETASSANYTSIAFPAICTGIFNYPAGDATLVIVQAVKTYLESHRRHSLKEVYLCHVDTSTVQHFCKALQKVFPSAHAQSTPIPKPRPTTQTKYQNFAPLPVASGGAAAGSNYSVINVVVVEGKIAEQRADVIVNSTSNGLDLKNGAVSSSILKVGGPNLQDECRTRYPSGISKVGDIAFTSGYGLACREVFHLALCNWQNPNAEQLLGHLVTKCLTEASKRHYTSIAFPVLGTGNLGYPTDVVANTMLGAISEFQQATPSTTLREARIVVYHTDKQILQALRTVQSQMGGQISSAPSPLHKTASTRQGRKFSEATAEQHTPASQPKGSVASAKFDVGGLTLIIRQGDITEETVDAIINSSNGQLDLSRGGVASALKNKCGRQLVDECKRKVGEIQDTGVAMTRAYNLHCKIILHIDAERFSTDKWEAGIKLCLQTAEDNGVKSMALPALGTGGYGMSAYASAKALFNTIVKFSKKRQCLTELRVVLFDKKMIPQYVSAVQSAAESHNKDNKGFVSWVKGLAGYSSPDVTLTHSSPVIEEAKLFVYAGSPGTVQAVLKALEDMVKDRFTRKVLYDDTLISLSRPEIDKIYQVGQKHSVEVRVQTVTGQLTVDGMHNPVFEAMTEISQLVRTYERRRQDQLAADMLVNMVQWYFLEVTTTGTEKIEYPKAENRIIEMAYQNKKPTAEITDSEGKVYVVDFNSMMEHPKYDPSELVGVIRQDKMKDMASGSLPENWATHTAAEQIKLVSLGNSDAEYQQVEQNFKATLGSNRNVTITAIDRIQNPTLYRQYAAKKAHMEKQNQGIQNEMTLWHGTAADAMDNINMYGFNRSYCGKNATVYGQGVYFALNSNYSTSTTYSPPDGSGKRHVYQCKVLVGHPTKGHDQLRTLPARQNTAQGQILYDSATDNPQKPGMYVIFNDTQAYPEYLVTFTGR